MKPFTGKGCSHVSDANRGTFSAWGVSWTGGVSPASDPAYNLQQPMLQRSIQPSEISPSAVLRALRSVGYVLTFHLAAQLRCLRTVQTALQSFTMSPSGFQPAGLDFIKLRFPPPGVMHRLSQLIARRAAHCVPTHQSSVYIASCFVLASTCLLHADDDNA